MDFMQGSLQNISNPDRVKEIQIMPKARGTFLASRPRQVNFKNGNRAGTSKTSYQIAFVPAADPHAFPALLTTSEDIFNELQGVGSGEKIEIEYLETVLDERIVHAFAVI